MGHIITTNRFYLDGSNTILLSWIDCVIIKIAFVQIDQTKIEIVKRRRM